MLISISDFHVRSHKIVPSIEAIYYLIFILKHHLTASDNIKNHINQTWASLHCGYTSGFYQLTCKVYNSIQFNKSDPWPGSRSSQY